MAKLAKPLALVLLLLVVSASIVAAKGTGESCNSDSDCDSGTCTYGYCSPVPRTSWALGDWIPIAALAVLVAYLIVGLAYMIGMGFQYRELVAWANSEFWEATLNAALVGLCIALVLMISDLTLVMTGSTDHIQEGKKYLDWAGGDLGLSWAGLMGQTEVMGIGASTWWRFTIPIPIIPTAAPTTILYLRSGSTLAFLAGWQQIISGFGPLIYIVAVSMFGTFAQKAMLLFAQNNMLSVFLPLGIIARGFPLTRKMGGTLIAMALALYFVYPLTLVLSGSIYSLYHGNHAGSEKDPDMGYFEGGATMWIVVLIRGIVRTAVVVMFMFVLDVIITITAFRSIASSIGGDPNIFGLGKLGV